MWLQSTNLVVPPISSLALFSCLLLFEDAFVKEPKASLPLLDQAMPQPGYLSYLALSSRL